MKHGKQFDKARYDFGNEAGFGDVLSEYFNARNVVAVEGDEVYDNYKENKLIHEVIDYAGIDYLVDTFDDPLFGINHRNHSPTNSTLRFDIRKDTGTKSPSELEKLLKAADNDIVPKYATRMKKGKNGSYEWIRMVKLEPLVGAISDGLKPSKVWESDGVVAWMFDYSLLEDMGVVKTIGNVNKEYTQAEL